MKSFDLQQPIIELKNISKTFSYSENEALSIREKVKQLFSSKSSTRKIKCLQNINLKVYPGEFIGIIGHNGSGKSTLLKIILGAFQPDKGGEVLTRGKIIRLALGLGFDYNLSARDNIYVNGSILGLNFKQIGEIFDQILTFADLQDFADTPIKFYSSGMISRLAFSIAIQAQSDILLIDEFFGGVGDVNFKTKSEKAFEEFIKKNKTILIVSHDLDLMRQKCDRILVLDHGKQIGFGKPNEMIDYYRKIMQN